MKKILYLYFGSASPVTKFEIKTIKDINLIENNLKIDFWDWTSELGLKVNPSLKWSYKNQNILKPFYSKLLDVSKDYDCIFIAQTGGIIPEIMDEISTKVVYNTADDPESSENCSFPFTKCSDIIVHAGVRYDETFLMGDILKKKGAKETYLMPIGYYEDMFPEILDFAEVFERRDVPVVFVGAPKIGKLEKIFRHFGNDINAHCRSQSSKISKAYYRIVTGKKIDEFEGPLHALYNRSQVGINVHYSFGPSNVRTYQLCAAGIAQVVDCLDGVDKLFNVGEEILSFTNQNEAIQHIEHLLKDKYFRYQISYGGYKRVRSCYNRQKLLTDLFKYI